MFFIKRRTAIQLIALLAFFSIAHADPYDVAAYLHPAPNASYASAYSPIIVRFKTALLEDPDSAKLAVYQGKSGVHGATTLCSDGRTLIFQSDKPFKPGAKIRVKIHSNQLNCAGIYRYTFKVATFESQEQKIVLDNTETPRLPLPKKVKNQRGPRIMSNGVSVPSDFPYINISTLKSTADGYLFLNNKRLENPYTLILNNDGTPVWYRRSADGDRQRDLKVQKNGMITMLTQKGGQRFLGYDPNFEFIDEFRATAGYYTDEHELQVLENGNYLLLGARRVKVDMSHYVDGGQPDAEVLETCIQEYTPEHELLFLWPGLQHLSDALPYMQIDDPAAASFRFPHMNAIDIDTDGHILLSSRMISEVTKIHRQTGEIIWRLGGPFNQFTFINDSIDGFRNQHDIRSLGNNLYSVFDNGNSHDPPRSRGAIYRLDTENMTATLVWEHWQPEGTPFSTYMGSHQQLPNGNSLINWAVTGRPKATEITADGDIVYEMDFQESYHTYRTLRFPWNGTVKAPNLHVEIYNNCLTLLFNKFGDDDVAYYNIYGGTRIHPATVMDTSRATMKCIDGLESGKKYFFRVTAVSNSGQESDFSVEKSLFVNIKKPGENLISNGSFSKSVLNWKLDTKNPASADLYADDKIGHISIENGGENAEHVLLKQSHIYLCTGAKYVLQFDAWAKHDRIINVMLGQVENPDVDYSKIGSIVLSRRMKHYQYEFVMTSSSDYDAELCFFVGGIESDVFLDNISLVQKADVSVDQPQIETMQPYDFALYDAFPNPFNAQTKISYSLPRKDFVILQIYNVLGEEIETLVNQSQEVGEYTVTFDASEYGSGVFLYQLSTSQGVLTKRMLFLK